MTQPDVPVRKRSWKPLLLFLALFSAATLALCLWIITVADRRWEVMGKGVHELISSLSRRDMTRPALAGEPIPGNGWKDYETANSLALPIYPLIEKDFVPFLRRPETAELDKIRNDLGLCSPFMESLRRGAHHTSAQSVGLDSDGLRLRTPRLRLHISSYVLRSHARIQKRDGQPGEALRTLLDLCQVAQDLNEHYIDSTILDDLMFLFSEETLTEDELRTLETAMERAEQSSNTGQGSGVEDLARDASALLRGGSPSTPDWDVWPSWRYGFSLRLQRADAVLALIELATAQATLIGTELETYQEQWGFSHFQNRIAGYHYPSYQRRWKPWNSDIARFRLLRVAAHFKLRGEILPMKDPWGDQLLHSKTDSEDRFWSIGINQKDDGGIGAFGYPEAASSQPDIVIVVRRSK